MTPTDIQTMARTLYGEARGEPFAGKLACAWVMQNRATLAKAYAAKNGKRHPLFGDGTVAGACLAPWQFSAWNANDPNRALLEKLDLPADLDNAAFRSCLTAALMVLEGQAPDPTKGATHYHTVALGFPKAWGERKDPLVTIGAHRFYKL